MKKLIMSLMLGMSWTAFADTWTDSETGITWSYTVSGGDATIVQGSSAATSTLGAIAIPSAIDSYPVTCIGSYAFYRCNGLTSVTIPSSVTNVGFFAFRECRGLTSATISEGVTSIEIGAFEGCDKLTDVTVPSSVKSIGREAFDGCTGLRRVTISEGVTNVGNLAFAGCIELANVTIPSSVTGIGSTAFYCCSNLGNLDVGASVSTIGKNCFSYCRNLTNVVFRGDAPTTIGDGVFTETPLDLNIVVPVGSVGWNGDATSTTLPTRWPYNTESGRYIRNAGEAPISSSPSSSRVAAVQLVVTNIVVNYVLNSIQPELAFPVSPDTEFVNIIAEVHGSTNGAVAVPDTWQSNYADYTEKFGGDFAQSLAKKTGKKDAAGNPMCVWQDYVAGTDPTDETSVFKASVTMVDGEPVVSWTPELPTDQADLRKYTTYGKARLQDAEWTVVNGDAAKYNFFKVTVEMK